MSVRPRTLFFAAALAATAPALDAAAQTQQSQTVHLPEGFSPNPIMRELAPGLKTVRPRDLGASSNYPCRGYTTRAPMLTFRLDKPMNGNLVLRAHGKDLTGIVVFFPGRKYICSGRGPLRMKEWPAGEMRVHLTGSSNTEAHTYTIELEDISRGDVLAKDLPTRTLSENPKKPIVLSGKVHGDIGLAPYRVRRAAAWECRNLLWARQPDLVFEIDRPLKNIRVRMLWSRDKVRFRLLKLPAAGQPARNNVFGRCERDNDLSFATLDDGKYALYVGGDAAARGKPYHLVLTGKETVVDPLALAPSIPANPSIAERLIWLHFPFLADLGRGHQRDVLEHALFMKAPKQLFAYIKFDMDEASASPAFHFKKDQLRYPKATEPVLILRTNRVSATVMTADGDRYHIKHKYLLDAPRGQVALPKAVRHTEMHYDTAREHAAPADKRHLARHERLLEQINKCIDRRWEPYQRQIDALRRGPWSKHRALRIDAIKRRGDRAIDRSCRPQRRKASQEKLRALLIKTRTKRRNQALAQIRRRFGVQ